jgi:membrane glycosyltransferase
VAPGAVWFWAPFVFGLAAAVPLTSLSAHPALGRLLGAAGLCSVPEELARPEGDDAGDLFAPFATVSAVSPAASAA